MIWTNITNKPRNCRQDCFNLGDSNKMFANAGVTLGHDSIPLAENTIIKTPSVASGFGKALVTSLLWLESSLVGPSLTLPCGWPRLRCPVTVRKIGKDFQYLISHVDTIEPCRRPWQMQKRQLVLSRGLAIPNVFWVYAHTPVTGEPSSHNVASYHIRR